MSPAPRTVSSRPAAGPAGARHQTGHVASQVTVGWGLVLAVKLLPLAKTRLQPLDQVTRAELALAFAGDALAAVLACPAVLRTVLVTSDPRAASALRDPRVLVVEDPADGLDAAFLHGAAHLPRGLPTASLMADLPCLRPQDLAHALRQVHGRGFVADTAGTGTTLLAAAAGHALTPAFGPGSAARHESSGAGRLRARPGLARDVDTREDLIDALRLGVGPRTAAVVASRAAVQPDTAPDAGG